MCHGERLACHRGRVREWWTGDVVLHWRLCYPAFLNARMYKQDFPKHLHKREQSKHSPQPTRTRAKRAQPTPATPPDLTVAANTALAPPNAVLAQRAKYYPRRVLNQISVQFLASCWGAATVSVALSSCGMASALYVGSARHAGWQADAGSCI